MSYSTQDIEEAFECGGDNHNEIEPIGMTKARVLTHLEGNCSCDRRRCEKCGARPRNGITHHKERCPWR